LPEGSLVVNSSQGGGSKDTWVLAAAGTAEPEPHSTESSAALAGPDLTEPEADQPDGAGALGLGGRVFGYRSSPTPPDVGPRNPPHAQQQQQQQGRAPC
jgi:hypothetical protein